jgi:hypothetical protein
VRSMIVEVPGVLVEDVRGVVFVVDPANSWRSCRDVCRNGERCS